jgi:Na+/glutamate symporter
LKKLGWPEGTDLALGLATISIVMAIFLSIFIINFYHRKNDKILNEAAMRSQQQTMIRNGYSLTKFANSLEVNPRELLINYFIICNFYSNRMANVK